MIYLQLYVRFTVSATNIYENVTKNATDQLQNLIAHAGFENLNHLLLMVVTDQLQDIWGILDWMMQLNRVRQRIPPMSG